MAKRPVQSDPLVEMLFGLIFIIIVLFLFAIGVGTITAALFRYFGG